MEFNRSYSRGNMYRIAALNMAKGPLSCDTETVKLPPHQGLILFIFIGLLVPGKGSFILETISDYLYFLPFNYLCLLQLFVLFNCLMGAFMYIVACPYIYIYLYQKTVIETFYYINLSVSSIERINHVLNFLSLKSMATSSWVSTCRNASYISAQKYTLSNSRRLTPR